MRKEREGKEVEEIQEESLVENRVVDSSAESVVDEAAFEEESGVLVIRCARTDETEHRGGESLAQHFRQSFNTLLLLLLPPPNPYLLPLSLLRFQRAQQSRQLQQMVRHRRRTHKMIIDQMSHDLG